ncbi:MAG TPA: hypothetical protein VE990_00230 [Acidimicrobiales bacterium]|nr:hypothetical protein [Acidimicrobiales bacterium]
MVVLRRGQVLVSGDGSRRYLVAEPLGAGGYADVFAGWRLGRTGRKRGAVCLKVSRDGTSWHGESYFGQLMGGDPRVVQLLDSFPHFTGNGAGRKTLFVLVFELEDQNVAEWFASGGTPWTESGARRELIGLLRVLEKLHRMGASHRDIKPDNVYVAPHRRLKLGDFGVARHAPGGGPVGASAFAIGFVPDSLRTGQRSRWYPSDDLYQLGLLILTVLTGETVYRASRRRIERLELSPDLETALVRATGPRGSRYQDAAEMLTALTEPHAEVARPRSLAGKRVVFTGRLPIAHHEAQARLAEVGGIYQAEVTGRTDVLVVGSPSPAYRRGRRGTKFADATRAIKAGKQIAIIGWDDFIRLTRIRQAASA